MVGQPYSIALTLEMPESVANQVNYSSKCLKISGCLVVKWIHGLMNIPGTFIWETLGLQVITF